MLKICKWLNEQCMSCVTLYLNYYLFLSFNSMVYKKMEWKLCFLYFHKQKQKQKRYYIIKNYQRVNTLNIWCFQEEEEEEKGEEEETSF